MAGEGGLKGITSKLSSGASDLAKVYGKRADGSGDSKSSDGGMDTLKRAMDDLKARKRSSSKRS